MESLVVTLETASRLETTGFKQVSAFRWYRCADHQGQPWHVNIAELDDVDRCCTVGHDASCAAPTAQEIADQLPPFMFIEEAGFNGLLTIKHGPKGIDSQPQRGALAWGAAYFVAAKSYGPIGAADTIAEALAALWLQLQEAK